MHAHHPDPRTPRAATLPHRLATRRSAARRLAPRALLLAGGVALALAAPTSSARAATTAPAIAHAAIAAPATSVDLDAAQAKLLSEAATHLKNLRVNLKLAVDTLPKRGTLSASKKKLAQLRLDSAKGAVPAVEERLAKLPADDAQVAAVQADFDAAKQSIAEVQAVLDGGEPAQPVAAGTRLDYLQEKALSDLRFFIQEVQRRSQPVAQIAAQVQQVADKETLDHRVVQQAMNTIAEARAKVGNANDRVVDLPADGTGVPEAVAALQAEVASLDASERILAPAHATLTALIDPARYPQLDADLERLSEFTRMFGNPQLLQTDRARAAEIVGQANAAHAEATRIATEYLKFINQQTELSKRLGGNVTYFFEKYGAFGEAVATERANLPASMDADFASVEGLVQQAVAERKPAFFTGGIPQQLGWIEDKLALYRAIGGERVAAYDERMAALETSLDEAQAALLEDIIASNRMPQDGYQGAERDRVVQLAKTELAREFPDAEVLAAAIPSQDWKRETLWRNQTGDWYKIDRSKLQVQLVVKRDDRLAEVRPYNLWKDHLQGDAINVFPFYAADEELGARALMLLENVR